ncbi:MAG TPA: Rv3235 family protein [Mycobacterium sp.]|nr:Rv3235 family protein [Mycobacterium sp.]
MSVSPIADYEPLGLSAFPEPARKLRRQKSHLVVVEPPELSARLRSATIFADAALRVILEVIDRRRVPAQLRQLMAPGLIESVAACARAAPVHSGVLRRVRLQPADAAETAFEVSATYTRGARTHAVACRVESAAGTAWQIVALHIG